MSDSVEEFLFEYQEEKYSRLDHFLVSRMQNITRSRLQALIDEGNVYVNGYKPKKAGLPLKNGDKIRVILPENHNSTIKAETIPLEVIFENADVIVINKPAGMVVHPSLGHHHGTLVNAVLGYAPYVFNIGGENRPGIVHRLDKDTSGVLIIAKNEGAYHFLQQQFQKRKVEKKYYALVDGNPPTKQGRIEAALARDEKHRKKISIVPAIKGRASISIYQVIQIYKKHSLLEVYPLTGRTHQIRVHLAFIGCPVVGDTLYGYKHPTLQINRHFLHAFSLKILLPFVNEEKEFTAPLPQELTKLLSQLEVLS